MDIYQFVRANKKITIWFCFFAMLYLVRKIFVLVFLTYILCYIFNNIIMRLERLSNGKRRIWIITVYLVFISVVTGLFFQVSPHIIEETKMFFKKLPQSLDSVNLYLDDLALRQPQIGPVVEQIKEAASLKNLFGINREALVEFMVRFFNRAMHFSTYLLLSTLFSFLILLDLPRLKKGVTALKNTRFKAAYDETADSVVQFAVVMGNTFQAQILIALVNTALTSLGLWFLEIGAISLLAWIVFSAGLIPVVGTFISSAPILLLAFNEGGIVLVGKAVLMISLVHAVEAYILNPRIFSAVFKINPLLTLIILYVGNSLFGLWGILLGVPVSVYVYRHILMAQNGHDGPEKAEKRVTADKPGSDI